LLALLSQGRGFRPSAGMRLALVAPLCGSRLWLAAVLASFSSRFSTLAEERFQFNYAHHGQDWRSGHCGSRERQSPLDFSAKAMLLPASDEKLYFSYEAITGGFTFQNNGHTLSADMAGQGFGGISYEGGWYNIMNINFHAKSEHTFAGRHYALEMHLVHKQYDGNSIIIVAVPIDNARKVDIDLVYGIAQNVPGAAGFKGDHMTRVVADFPNPALLEEESSASGKKKRLLRGGVGGGGPWFPADLPPYKGPDSADANFNIDLQGFLKQRSPKLYEIQQASATENQPINLNNFLKDGTYIEYQGSYTAPPCTEAVTWMVRREPIMASNEQVRFLYETVYMMTNDFGNYRSTMPLNGRWITVRAGENRIPVLTESANMTFAPVSSPRQFAGLTDAQAAYKNAIRNAKAAAELDDRIRRAGKGHADQLATEPGPPYNLTELNPVFPTPPGYREPPCDTIGCKLSKMGDEMKDKINTTSRNLVRKASYEIASGMHGATLDAVRDYLLSQTPAPFVTPFPPDMMPTRSPPVTVSTNAPPPPMPDMAASFAGAPAMAPGPDGVFGAAPAPVE